MTKINQKLTHNFKFNLMKYALIFLLLCSSLFATGQQEKPVNVGQSIKIHSKVLNEDRIVLVYLPDGYKESSITYPVIYLMDAETHWLHMGSTTRFLSLLSEMPKVIIVGITNSDRARDMTPHPAVPDKDFPNGGGSESFLTFINEELKPFIKTHYRTDPFTILAGTSLSGLFVINSFITQPDAFNAYIAASPSLWWDNKAVIYKAEKFLKTSFNNNRFLFVSLCDGDSKALKESTQFLMKDIESRPVDSLHWQYLYVPGENHNSSPLKSFYAGFQWLYDGWQPKSLNSIESLQQHYQFLSKRYEYSIAIPETEINNLGYSLLFSDKKQQAIAVLKVNTEKYPDSPNGWDSLGDAYKANNQLDSAKNCYEKGCTLGKQTNNINTPSMCSNLEEIIKMIEQKTNKKN